MWAIMPAYLALHGIVATCLPDGLDPASTLCIVLAEVAAMAAALWAGRNATRAVRTFWLLLATSILFHATAMSLDAASEITRASVFNHVPRLQIFFSMLYDVPLLVAVSRQSDQRVRGAARAVNAIQSIAVVAVLYLQIFTLLTVNGSRNPADALLIMRLFDGIDIFLAAASTLRWLGCDEVQECHFFRILSIFLWINALLPAIHNRILMRHDYVWLDLFISTPYVVLFVLTLTTERRAARPLSAAMVRVVRSGSPIFLTLALVCAGISASRSHFYIGVAAVVLAMAGYGAINIHVQSRGLENEELLLASKENLERLVGIDSLTGIANRRAFDKMLDREFSIARRTKIPVSLLMIDVDHFKQINDTKGHQAGDEYLIRIATALRLTLPRVTDFVARYGGEEFSAILPATDGAGAVVAATRIQQGIANLHLNHPGTPSRTVTVSIGITTFDGSSNHSTANIVRVADRALYMAKESGRNCSEFLALDDAGR